MAWFDKLSILLFTNGVDPKHIDNLSIEQAQLLWKSYLDGIWGNYGIQKQLYNVYATSYVNTEVLAAANSSKPTKPKHPPTLGRLEPNLEQFIFGKPQGKRGMTGQQVAAKLGVKL